MKIHAVGAVNRYSGRSADSGLHQSVSAAAIGYELNPKWRVGGGLALADSSIRTTQVISDRIKDAHGLHTLLISSRADASSRRDDPDLGHSIRLRRARWRTSRSAATSG